MSYIWNKLKKTLPVKYVFTHFSLNHLEFKVLWVNSHIVDVLINTLKLNRCVCILKMLINQSTLKMLFKSINSEIALQSMERFSALELSFHIRALWHWRTFFMRFLSISFLFFIVIVLDFSTSLFNVPTLAFLCCFVLSQNFLLGWVFTYSGSF